MVALMDDVTKMSSPRVCCMLFERLDMLSHGKFRLMLASVGVGVFFSLSRLRWGFFDVQF
jgi:hypothetical protein